MRRLIRLVMVLGLVAAGLFSGARAAGATAPCPGDPYPVGVGATISASTTTPYVGQTIKVGGRNFGADEDVVISIGGTQVATAHTDVMGSFDPNAEHEEFKAILWRINVDADDQGRGIGTFAVRALADEARQRGLKRLYVIWESGELGPEQFFLRSGFQPVGETQYGETIGALDL